MDVSGQSDDSVEKLGLLYELLCNELKTWFTSGGDQPTPITSAVFTPTELLTVSDTDVACWRSLYRYRIRQAFLYPPKKDYDSDQLNALIERVTGIIKLLVDEATKTGGHIRITHRYPLQANPASEPTETNY